MNNKLVILIVLMVLVSGILQDADGAKWSDTGSYWPVGMAGQGKSKWIGSRFWRKIRNKFGRRKRQINSNDESYAYENPENANLYLEE